MRTKKNKVNLSKEERERLEKLTSSGKQSAGIIRRANILLSLDENNGKVKTQEELAEIYNCNAALIRTVAAQYVKDGIERVISRKYNDKSSHRKVTGEIEAKIIKLACSNPPEGRTLWTLCLLEEKVVELGISDTPISDNTIGRILKKHRSSLIRKKNGVYLPNKTRRS